MISMKKPIKSLANQAGATLLESLIALVVFSIGALGIAALQTATLVRSDDVKQRSIAIWKAQELADRIKASGSTINPNGLSQAYIDEISPGNNVDAGIGDFDNTPSFVCPNNEPTRCDDVEGTDAAICTAADLVTFDTWSVLCDPVSGVSSTQANLGTNDGENKLKNLDVALTQDANGEFLLFFEWLSRSADQNEDFQAGVTVTTDLCGTDRDVDSRLGVYCLRFR